MFKKSHFQIPIGVLLIGLYFLPQNNADAFHHRWDSLKVTGISAGAPAPAPIPASVPPSSSGWATGEIIAEGSGVAPERAKTAAQAKLLAVRAAKADAQRNLLEQIQGVEIDSSTTVRDFMTENDQINTRVRGIVRSAKVDERDNGDGSWTVVLVLEKSALAPIISGAPAPAPRVSGSPGVKNRAMALRAAKLDAQRRLIEEVYGTYIESSSSVTNFELDYDRIQSSSSGVLRFAKTMSENYNSSTGEAEVTLFLHKRHVKKLYKNIKRYMRRGY